MTPARVAAAAALVGVGVALAVLAMTAAGIGVTADSVTYLDAARRFANGEGMRAYHERGVLPLTHFPPLYPWLLSGFVRLGISAETGARLLNCIAAGLTAALLFGVVARVSHSTAAGVVLAVGFVLAQGCLRIYATAWSEAVFLLLLAALLLAVLEFLDRAEPRWIVLAAVLAGLAGLTRYAGVVLIGYVSVLALQRWRRGQLRPTHAAVVLFAACGPLLLWLVRNRLVAGSTANRALVIDAPRSAELAIWVRTLGTWLLPIGPFALQLAIGVLLAGMSCWLFLRRRERTLHRIATHVFALLWLYVLFVLVARLLLDRWLMFDLRMAAPALLLATVLVAALLAQPARFPLLRRTIAAVWLLLLGAAAAPVIGSGLQVGWGIEAPGWRDLDLPGWTTTLPAGIRVYSNVPDAIYYHTGMVALSLPRAPLGDRGDELSAEPVPLERVLADVRADSAVVLFFSTAGPATVQQRLGDVLGPPRAWRSGVLIFAREQPR